MPPSTPRPRPTTSTGPDGTRPAAARPVSPPTVRIPPARPMPPARAPQRPQTPAPAATTPAKAPPPQAPPSAPDPQTAVEDTPIFQLRQPVQVHSALLGETIAFVANDVLAEPLRQQGPVPYMSREIVQLSRIRFHTAPADWPARLRLIHEAKQLFGGTIIEYSPPAVTAKEAQPEQT